MRVTYRIPTSQFAFIEIEKELDLTIVGMKIPTPEEIVEKFNQYEKAYADAKILNAPMSGTGLPEKEFDRFIQTQLEGGQNHVEVYNLMSPEQQKFVQAYKRALNRIRAKGMRAMSGAPEDDIEADEGDVINERN